ncbi:hypothetical protein AAC387_Pa08g1094 [Persea americana]
MPIQCRSRPEYKMDPPKTHLFSSLQHPYKKEGHPTQGVNHVFPVAFGYFIGDIERTMKGFGKKSKYMIKADIAHSVTNKKGFLHSTQPDALRNCRYIIQA